MQNILKSGAEWYKELYPNNELKIMDYDGWDRGDFDYSWNEDKIDLKEFHHRLGECTVQIIRKK